jgi:hypothetical protein
MRPLFIENGKGSGVNGRPTNGKREERKAESYGGEAFFR